MEALESAPPHVCLPYWLSPALQRVQLPVDATAIIKQKLGAGRCWTNDGTGCASHVFSLMVYRPIDLGSRLYLPEELPWKVLRHAARHKRRSPAMFVMFAPCIVPFPRLQRTSTDAFVTYTLIGTVLAVCLNDSLLSSVEAARLQTELCR